MEEIKKISYEDVWPLRHRVMWPTKDFDYIKVEGDEEAIHYGIFIDNKLVSCVSLFIKDNKGQFRKFATEIEYQGKGYGTKLLTYVIESARDMNLSSLWCNARIEKIDFYKKFGLKETSSTFEKDSQKYMILQLLF